MKFFKTSCCLHYTFATGGKKNRQKERRLMKGFNLATVGGAAAGSQTGLACSTPSLAGSSIIPTSANACSRASMQTLDETGVSSSPASQLPSKSNVRSPITKLAQLARLAGSKKTESKKKWGNLIEAAKSAKGVGRNLWARSRSRSEDSVSSDGSGGAGAAAQGGDEISNSSRREKYNKTRASFPVGVVHVTENELPEVTEESGIDYELSGRMGMDHMDSVNITQVNSTTNFQRFRRACSEPADQVTLVLETTRPRLAAINSEDSETQLGSKQHSIVNLSSSSVLSCIAASGGNPKNQLVSPLSSKATVSEQTLKDGQILPYMDDSSDPTSETSQIDPYKPFNGLPTVVCETSSGEAVHGIQPHGRNLTGGWL